MRFFLSLILVAAFPAFAIPTPSINVPHWQCQLSASLQGNPQHFMYYGRDSWQGTGMLRCRTKTGLEESLPLVVDFSSAFDGFGADYRSVVEIRVFIATYLTPSELQLRAMVKDMDRGPNIRFAIANDQSEARVYILSSSPESAIRSLQNGTLYIRGQSGTF